jgi:hypothetical protein
MPELLAQRCARAPVHIKLRMIIFALLSRLGQASPVTNDLAGSITGGVRKRACRELDGRY